MVVIRNPKVELSAASIEQGTAGAGAGPGQNGASWPVTAWQGRQHFATAPPPVPPAPGAPPRSVEGHPAYHARFVALRTPAIDMRTC